MSVKIRANAKLNLTLNVEGMYDDSYHGLSSVIVSVDVSDTVTVSPRLDQSVSVTVNGNTDENNVAFKVANAICKRFGTKGVDIIVEKNVAAGGGMGGSSVDAAATIAAMTNLFGLNVDEKMLAIATEFGSDIAYMIRGGLGLATGKGDDIMFVGNDKVFNFVVINGARLNTRDVFAEYDNIPDHTHYDNKALLCALENGDIAEARRQMGNNLQSAAFRLAPEMLDITYACLKNGLPDPVMTGSGGNLFILCKDNKEAQKFAAKLAQSGVDASVCKSVDTGIEILE